MKRIIRINHTNAISLIWNMTLDKHQSNRNVTCPIDSKLIDVCIIMRLTFKWCLPDQAKLPLQIPFVRFARNDQKFVACTKDRSRSSCSDPNSIVVQRISPFVTDKDENSLVTKFVRASSAVVATANCLASDGYTRCSWMSFQNGFVLQNCLFFWFYFWSRKPRIGVFHVENRFVF